MNAFRVMGRGRQRPDGMNRLESEYASFLELRKRVGEIVWWSYEPMKLRLAANTFYSPDFGVMLADGAFELHETKGFWEDDARVKIKCAAEKFPFRFVGVKKKTKREGGGWEFENF